MAVNRMILHSWLAVSNGDNLVGFSWGWDWYHPIQGAFAIDRTFPAVSFWKVCINLKNYPNTLKNLHKHNYLIHNNQYHRGNEEETCYSRWPHSELEAWEVHIVISTWQCLKLIPVVSNEFFLDCHCDRLTELFTKTTIQTREQFAKQFCFKAYNGGQTL